MDIWTFGYIWIHLDTFGYGYIWNIRWSLIAETLVPLCAISRLSSPRSTGDPGDPQSLIEELYLERHFDTMRGLASGNVLKHFHEVCLGPELPQSASLLSLLLQLHPWDLRWNIDWTMKIMNSTRLIFRNHSFYCRFLPQWLDFSPVIVTRSSSGHGSATRARPLRATWHSESRGSPVAWMKSEVDVCLYKLYMCWDICWDIHIVNHFTT